MEVLRLLLPLTSLESKPELRTLDIGASHLLAPCLALLPPRAAGSPESDHGGEAPAGRHDLRFRDGCEKCSSGGSPLHGSNDERAPSLQYSQVAPG